jgi:hypothetical protein
MVKEPCTDITGRPLKVANKTAGYLYFVDTDGSVMKAKMMKGKRLPPEEIKRREMAKEAKRAARAKRAEANKARELIKLEEKNKRALAEIEARKAKAETLKQ